MKITIDGEPVTIRPIRRTDAEMESDFIDRLSSESKHFRLLGGVQELPQSELTRICDVDGKYSMAFVATVNRDGHEVEIGVSRYVPEGESDVREIAATVADEWQNKDWGHADEAADPICEVLWHQAPVFGRFGGQFRNVRTGPGVGNVRNTRSWRSSPGGLLADVVASRKRRRRPFAVFDGFHGIRRYCMCWPPLIAILAPVTNAASSLARYATSPATSSGLPSRPMGICGMIFESRTSFGIAMTILVPI